jgi:hypothetical protein
MHTNTRRHTSEDVEVSSVLLRGSACEREELSEQVGKYVRSMFLREEDRQIYYGINLTTMTKLRADSTLVMLAAIQFKTCLLQKHKN